MSSGSESAMREWGQVEEVQVLPDPSLFRRHESAILRGSLAPSG